ncbi:unnamed protein product [Clonostachys byssicola]|uniref:Uncharacterized protein n=1 Tax=Clonostachys byssicola TaxID=160290 RepID=A0A9N9UFQ8_9HYPO|nr:unnamed protein product [Clonostachys byssicola]
MATTAHNNAEDEISQLNYIQDSELFLQQKPYEILSEAPPGTQKCNFQLGQGPPEIIQDIRGLESQFDLDNHGFQVVRHMLKTKVFDEDTIKSEYIPEIDMLLKSIEPDISVHVFDWRLRSSSVPDPKLRSIVDLNDPMLVLKPVQAVHVDQSPYAAMKHARSILGDDPDAIMNKRIRIIKLALFPSVVFNE